MVARAGVAALGIGACGMFASLVYAGGESKSSKATSTTGGESQALTGQELYAIHCNRCHSERYPTEWTAAHWRTIMTHMRVRANLPAEQAKEILKYLEQDAGN